MSIRVAILSSVKPNVQDRLMAFLEENLPAVRNFCGCLDVAVLLSPDKTRMLFDEQWLDRAHHQAYIASIEKNGVLHALASFLEAPPEILYLESVAI